MRVSVMLLSSLKVALARWIADMPNDDNSGEALSYLTARPPSQMRIVLRL